MPILSSRLAPGFIRFRYTGVTQPHTGVIPIKFAAAPVPGVNPTLLNTGGTEVLFTVAIADYIATALVGSFDAATVFGFADIYAVDPVSGVRTFIYTVNLNDLGEAVTPNVALVEGIFVFKSTVGKPIKIYTMEGVYNPDQRSVGEVPPDGRQDLVNYILSPANIVYGRDDAWPLAFLSFTSKVNDTLRRREGFGGL